MRQIVSLAAILTLCAASPAAAGPVVTAITPFFASLGASAATASVLAGWAVQTAISIGVSALAQAVRGKSKAQTAGITTEVTSSGGTTPQRFILGYYATAGQMIAPPMSYGDAGGTPRGWLVYVIALSAIPGVTVNRVVIDDAYGQDVDTTPTPWGFRFWGPLVGKLWVDTRDGYQTSAHAGLLAAFGSDPDRPWNADMVGIGTAYAVVRAQYNREVWSGLPSVRFECLGVPLYDPRADGSVGGSGAQRWDTPATWAQTTNPAVMIYNILRGIRLPDGAIWGGQCTAEDLPLANWFAAMNECDLAVAANGGGVEAQFRAGLEVSIDQPPADVIEDLLKACAGQIVEVGGIWKLRCGPPGLPVMTFVDEDVIASEAEEFDPFPGLSETWNGITATYPEPASLWETKEAPPRYNPTWETEDGGRRLVANLTLAACPYAGQVQRLMAQGIADHRRFRRHRLTLPPEAAVLEPLDAVAWTSARNGYSAKTFEITGLADHLGTLTQTLMLRERDSTDYAWSGSGYLVSQASAPGVARPAAQTVPGFAALATVVTDGAADRRPAISLLWDPTGAVDAVGIEWEIWLPFTVSPLMAGSYGGFAAGFTRLTEGILPSTVYAVRARLIVDRPTDWTGFVTLTTTNTRLALIDLNGQRRQLILAGPFTIPAMTSDVIGTLALGALGAGSIWKRGISFEAKTISAGNWTIDLQRRFFYAGVWSSWVTIESWEITSTAWDLFSDSGNVSGAYSDFEYRLVSTSAGTRPDCIRNLYLTAVNVAD